MVPNDGYGFNAMIASTISRSSSIGITKVLTVAADALISNAPVWFF